MSQFLVLAYDGTDPAAEARRGAARNAHLARIMPMVERGEVVLGGAILDDAEVMIGSAAIVDFPTRADLDAWLAQDPYVTGGVWQRIEVRPFRIAVRAAI